MTTYTLNNGTKVLGQVTGSGVFPVTYANDKQAYARKDKMEAEGVACSVYQAFGSRVRFIKLEA